MFHMTAAQEEKQEVRSHSQLSQYTECPRSYQLSRVVKLKRRPGAWFPAGTACHRAIERYLRWTLEQEQGNGGE